ncbi:MAG: hypothetical protein ACXAC7_06300 [Candidatus Hodarchaeales archaeon]|jgi:hypothetical protein
MTISLDKAIAEDLLNTKLQLLDKKIQSILDRWNILSIEEFVEKAKAGIIEEAESDAIELQNLADKRDEISKIARKIHK